jgi:hypothetical protein
MSILVDKNTRVLVLPLKGGGGERSEQVGVMSPAPVELIPPRIASGDPTLPFQGRENT